MTITREIFKYLFMLVVLGTVFAMIVSLAMGDECTELKIKYPVPYAIVIDKTDRDTIKKCQDDENCMDVLVWSDLRGGK